MLIAAAITLMPSFHFLRIDIAAIYFCRHLLFAAATLMFFAMPLITSLFIISLFATLFRRLLFRCYADAALLMLFAATLPALLLTPMPLLLH